MCAAPAHASGRLAYGARTHVVCLRLATGRTHLSETELAGCDGPQGDLCLFKVKLSAKFTFLPSTGGGGRVQAGVCLRKQQLMNGRRMCKYLDRDGCSGL